MELPEIQQAISKEKMLRMKVKEKQAAQRQIDIDTDSFRLKDQEEKLQAGRYIVELVSAVLAGREPDAKPEDLPVKAIYRMAKLHNLDCIVYDGMKRIAGEADADFMEKWANRNTICAAQGIMQQREAKKLVKELTARGIRVLPLKGSILKEIYPQARYRQMADVDILIDRKNMEKAHNVMKELGYQYKGGDSEDTVDKYYKPPCVSIEIHSHLMHYHAENYKKYLDIWERCKEENGVYHMNWDDYYLFLMEHFAKHFNESGSGIRFVLDIYIFLEAKKKELHPEYLKKKQKELGLEEFCREMEEIAYRWFDGRPEIRDSKYETVILLAGIFGIRQWAYAGQQKKIVENEKFIGENYVYDQIDEKYKMFLMNKIIYICSYLPDGYTKNTINLLKKNPYSYMVMKKQSSRISRKMRYKIKHMAGYIAMGLLKKEKKLIRKSGNPIIAIISYPVGILIYFVRFRE